MGAMPLCTSNYADANNIPPAWQDRKKGWWAVSAGNDGGTSNIVMRFYYQMQPGFYFPLLTAAEQPPVGQQLPWLPDPYAEGDYAGTRVCRSR